MPRASGLTPGLVIFFLSTGPRAGHIMPNLPPRHLLSLMGLPSMPASLPLQPSKEVGGPGWHINS